jgi:hypothetical protein
VGPGQRRAAGDAARELASLAAGGFSGVPVTRYWSIVIALLADAAAQLDEPTYALPLYERLHPYAGRVLVLGPTLECLGPADRYLGLLAVLRQEWTAAEAHFARSLEISRSMRALPFIARTLQNQAAALCKRGRREDAGRAESLLAEALTAAHRCGMDKVAREVAEAAQRLARHGLSQ